MHNRWRDGRCHGRSASERSELLEAVRRIVCQNSPAILTERAYHEAIVQGKGAARRRKAILPLLRILLKVFPDVKLPISMYLDFGELVDPKEDNRRIEAAIVEAYLRDPDLDRRYPLSAIMSLLLTPPPGSLVELKVSTMFLLPVRGFVPSYVRHLFQRLPPIKKKLLEVDGGVFWMCSHPREAANAICDWFDETV